MSLHLDNSAITMTEGILSVLLKRGLTEDKMDELRYTVDLNDDEDNSIIVLKVYIGYIFALDYEDKTFSQVFKEFMDSLDEEEYNYLDSFS